MRVYRNQVNVLIGENGAGKSTLMRILAGVETADEGELLLEGAPIRVRSPREAAALGISIVHQELSVLPNLDISENVFAGREPVRAAVLLDRPTEDARSAKALASLRKPMQVRTKTAQLSLGCRQIVEIARTLDQGAKILILDEPTSALSSRRNRFALSSHRRPEALRRDHHLHLSPSSRVTPSRRLVHCPALWPRRRPRASDRGLSQLDRGTHVGPGCE